MKQLAEILGSSFGDAVDILWDRRDTLVDPSRGLVGRGGQRVAKGACRRGHDEAADTSARRLLEQDQRATNIRLDERLARMRCDMWLMQGRDVQHRINALHAARDRRAVADRRDHIGERSRDDVETDRFAAVRTQGAHQRFTQMPGTAGDEHGHACASF